MNFININIGKLILIFFILVGLSNFDKYGISYDELEHRKIGRVTFDYIFSESKELLSLESRDHGPVFDVAFVIIEKVFRFEDSRNIYLAKHLFTHILFLISGYFCFLLIDFLYKDKLLASIGYLLIVLNPLLYAHSFFNPKDIPFLSMFLICLYLNVIASEKLRIKYFIILGVGVGLLIGIRIMGIILFLMIITFLIMSLLGEKYNQKSFKRMIMLILIFFLTTILTLYICWPFLWENPISNFIYAFNTMSKHPGWNFKVLFEGQFINSTEPKWNYIPVWFCITTPVFYLILGLSGIIILSYHIIKSPLKIFSNLNIRNNLFFALCFLSPVIIIIILKSNVFDGWRHLYFIYPAFVLLICSSLNMAFKSGFRNLFVVFTFLYFTYIISFMVKNNPFQHIYFNELTNTQTPEYIKSQFELDYWGTSYKQQLEFILKKDTSCKINIAVANSPGSMNRFILPIEDRKRLNFVKIEKAKYFITNYRWHPEDYLEFHQKKWHSIKVNNNTINEIYKLE